MKVNSVERDLRVCRTICIFWMMGSRVKGLLSDLRDDNESDIIIYFSLDLSRRELRQRYMAYSSAVCMEAGFGRRNELIFELHENAHAVLSPILEPSVKHLVC